MIGTKYEGVRALQVESFHTRKEKEEGEGKKEKKVSMFAPVSFSHIFCVWRADVLADDLFPSTTTKPSTKERLNFFNFP